MPGSGARASWAASRGELEAQVLRGEQAQAVAPKPARELRAVALAEAEAKIRATDPDAGESAKAEAASLAVSLGGQRDELDAVQADYEHWSAETAGIGKAPARPRRAGTATGAQER